MPPAPSTASPIVLPFCVTPDALIPNARIHDALIQEPKSQPDRPTERNDTGATAPGTAGVPTNPGTQGGPQGTGAQPQMCGTETIWMMGLFLLLMWFMVLRPESRRRKETASMLSALKQGDTVVTIGGMHGLVTQVLEKSVLLTVDNVQMTFDRTAIARVLRDEPASAAKKG